MVSLETIAITMTEVNNGLGDEIYHAVMAQAPMQFNGVYRFPDGQELEALSETDLHGHGLIRFSKGRKTVSASAVLDELEFVY